MADKDKDKPTQFPILDERIEFRGTSYLRSLTVEALRDLDNVIVLQTEGGERLAVIVDYEAYLELQKAALSRGQK